MSKTSTISGRSPRIREKNYISKHSFPGFLRRLCAGLLLLLFAFSITPKKTLHNFFADHKDTPIQAIDWSNVDKAQLSVAGYNCHVDNLVVESPFIEAALRLDLDRPTVWCIRYDPMECDFHQSIYRYSELRGPPTA